MSALFSRSVLEERDVERDVVVTLKLCQKDMTPVRECIVSSGT